MRLYEIAISGDTYYKAQSSTPEPHDKTWYDYKLQVSDLKKNIAGWKKNRNETLYDKMMIQKLEDKLSELEEIGEIPFTFYAAKDPEYAEYFQGQFENGEVVNVKLYAKNVATVDDLRALGFPEKRTVSHLTPMMVHKLKKAGFDAATGYIDNVGGTEVVVFSPKQVKVIK